MPRRQRKSMIFEDITHFSCEFIRKPIPASLFTTKGKGVFRVLCGSFFSVPNSAHVTILFFSAPQFTAPPPISQAPGMIAGTDNEPFRASQHSTLAPFCHLSCVPKKGDPKKGTRRKFFTACSVVLSTFRKLADRNIFVHQSLALRERVRVRVGFVPRLRQSEMLNPRTRSHA